MKKFLYSSDKSKTSGQKRKSHVTDDNSGEKVASLDPDMDNSSSFLKTQKKFNREEMEKVDIGQNQKTPVNAHKTNFGSKVLGNIDKRRRQLFFGSQNTKKQSNTLIHKTNSTSLLGHQKQTFFSPEPEEKPHPPQKQITEMFNSQKSSKTSDISSKKYQKKRQGRKSFLDHLSKNKRKTSSGHLFPNGYNLVQNQSHPDLIRISNANEIAPIKKKKEYTSYEMKEEMTKISKKLNQLDFPAQLVTELQRIFLPYIEVGVIKEKKIFELEKEVQNSTKVIKSLEHEMNKIRRHFDDKLGIVHKKYDKLLKTETELREEFERNYRIVLNENDELKNQTKMMNDVLKGLCNEKERVNGDESSHIHKLEEDNIALYKKVEQQEEELDDMKVNFQFFPINFFLHFFL